jgi:riboflavin kinase/FMN adenylyltransferase
LKIKRHYHALETQGSVVTIGNFDGIHRGHQALIEKLLETAEKKQLDSVLITFEPQPNEFFSKEAPPRLMKFREKAMALSAYPLDYLFCLGFTQTLADLSAEDFIQEILLNRCHMKHLIIGDDFRFGHLRKGDLSLLQSWGKTHDFTVEALSSVLKDQQRISSSQIRRLLENAELDAAKSLLGRPYGMFGRVGHGDKRGRLLGFPTANILIHRKKSPLRGVYAVKIRIEDKTYFGVANIGNRPTVEGSRHLLEVHIFDFNRDIYGLPVYVEFVKKIRDEKRFDNLPTLTAQIQADAQKAREILTI